MQKFREIKDIKALDEAIAKATRFEHKKKKRLEGKVQTSTEFYTPDRVIFWLSQTLLGGINWEKLALSFVQKLLFSKK